MHEYLKNHYARLSDDELLRVWRTDLVEIARGALRKEIESRGLANSLSTTPLSSTSEQPYVHQKASPRWSKFIQGYGAIAPWGILPLLGVRGILWLALISILSFLAALLVGIALRSRPKAVNGKIVVFAFIVIQALCLYVFAAVLRVLVAR